MQHKKYDIWRILCHQEAHLARYLNRSLRSSKELVPSSLSVLTFTAKSFFLGDLTIMKFVLERLIDTFLALHQSLTFFNSVLNTCSRLLRLRAEAKTFVSSANILKVSTPEQLGHQCKTKIRLVKASFPGEFHRLSLASKGQYSPTQYTVTRIC